MRNARSNRGTVLLVCLILTILILGLMAASVTLARATGGWFEHSMSQSEVLALAEAATELRQKAVIDEIANYAGDGTLLGMRDYFVTKGGDSYTVATQVTRQTIGGVADNELLVTDADGVVAFVSYYDISGTSSVDGDSAQVTRTIQVGRTPLFQFAVFYDDDLEILPGPSMTLAGRVHANGDIYLNTGGTLTIDSDYLRCTGELFRGRKDSADAPTGTVQIRKEGTGSYFTLTTGNAPATRWSGGAVDPVYYGKYGGDPNAWVTYAQGRWGDTVQTQAHGTREVAVPKIPVLAPGGYYHNEAGLVIENAGAGLKAYRRDGSGALTDVTNSLAPKTIALGTIYDAREGKKVSVIEVDMALLRTGGFVPANGLIYAYRSDTTTANPNGILFKNGKELSSATFMVSPDPVYVKGDFNAPAAGSGFTKQAAMVMCDAINILSNSWTGTKAAGTGIPNASATTVNLAMISGIVRTPDDPDGSYSGGLENYPRLHENWTGRELKIRGSFVSIFQSQYARGLWQYGSPRYTAPNRNWGFDPDLLKHHSSFLKDLIPHAVSVRRLAWSDNLASRF